MLYVTLHHIFIEGRPFGECRLALKSSFPSENGATSLSSHCTSGNILTLHLSAVEILSAGGLFENLKSTHTSLCLDITCFTLLHNHTTFIQVAKKVHYFYSNQILTISLVRTFLQRYQRLMFLTQLLPQCNCEVGVGKQRWMYSFSTPPHHSIQGKCPCMCSRSWRICLSDFWSYALKEEAASRQSQRSWVRPLRLSVSMGLD